MGSSNLNANATSTKSKSPCIYTNLSKYDVTCEKTNRIDIDKYFKIMQHEISKIDDPGKLRCNEKLFKRSDSSGKLESRKRRSQSSKKRSSCDVSILLGVEKDKSQERTIGYFSYDLSGQVVQVGEHKDDRCLSKQKSWDLSISKVKGPSRFQDVDDEHSHSCAEGELNDNLNNNTKLHSKSMESFQDLHARHRETAMTHGKIYSVSEQNRRLRKKYFRKEKANSLDKGKYSTSDKDDISKTFAKLVLSDSALV